MTPPSRGPDVVMFGPFEWDGTWYSRHHLAAGLARQARVIHAVEPPSLRDVVGSPGRGLRSGGFRPGPAGIEEFVPPGWLPDVLRWEGPRRWLRTRRARRLQRALRKRGIEDPLYYVWNPMYQPTVAELADPTLVYHAYDKYDQYALTGDETTRREEWLVRRSRLCVAASTRLGEYLESLGAARVEVVRHGVDSELFRPGLPEPQALASIPRPRLGIVARINEVLNTATLGYLAERRPDWSIVLVGGLYFSDDAKLEAFHQLADRPNVHHVGFQPREEIPNWLSGFDVGLICYDLATWGPYNQPIKMYEYLACGLPVVSTDIEAARELGEELVRCCNEPEEWLAAVEASLEETAPADVERRLAFARSCGWDRRVDQLASVLRTVSDP